MNRRDVLKSFSIAAAAGVTAGAAPAPAQKLVVPGKSRIRTAICAYSYREALAKKTMTYEDLVDVAVDNGIDGLDLTVYWFPETGVDKFLLSLRRKAYLSGVELTSISIRTECCQKDVEARKKEAAWISQWVDIADRVGASHIRVFGGTVPKGSTEDEGATWVGDVLKRAADYAGSKGVFLGLENHGGITLYAKRVVSIVEAVNHPWVGINLDTGNFRSDPYGQIEMCLPYAVNSQFKVSVSTDDGKREDCDWDRIVQMFTKAGYKGYVALEYEESENVAVAVPRYLKALREVVRKHSS
jgi:L-ribulose-5-phosphate 3-epimerase